MFYLFSADHKCIGTCDNTPCAADLASRGEYAMEYADGCQIGYINNNGTPEPPPVIPLTLTEREARARIQRDSLLLGFDRDLYRNQFFWATLSAEQQAERTNYRQALLDVPQQSGFPDAIQWPDYPAL